MKPRCERLCGRTSNERATKWRRQGTVEPACGSTRPPPADLIITDIFMPDFDGIETIRELRRVAPGVKVIVVSGGDSTGTLNMLDDATLLGADRAFHKPLKSEELLGAVREMLSENPEE